MYQKTKNVYHLLMAIMANLVYLRPSKDIRVIGITGTDGKTTTVSLVYHILSSAGLNVSMISSVGAIIDGKSLDIGFHVTNPSSWHLQKFIKMIPKTEGERFLVLEVTSHALDQYRNWGIDFEIGAITNATREHLDYHKTYENYVNTKARLLKMADTAIVNKDDTSFEILRKNNLPGILTYGFKQDADVNLKNAEFESSVPGEFNKYNILAAIAICRKLKISDKVISEAVSTFKLPIGRLEEVYKGNFRIMVDFAHTPNSFEQLLKSLRKDVKGRLIHLFGSAGKRDASKRPEMGRISSRYSDIIILTAEDPRTESVEEINRQIESGISRSFKGLFYKKYSDNAKNKKIYFKIDDRLEAVKFAVSIAKKGDLLVCTGKAHEKSMNLGKGEEPWDEFSAIRESIQEKVKENE